MDSDKKFMEICIPYTNVIKHFVTNIWKISTFNKLIYFFFEAYICFCLNLRSNFFSYIQENRFDKKSCIQISR